VTKKRTDRDPRLEPDNESLDPKPDEGDVVVLREDRVFESLPRRPRPQHRSSPRPLAGNGVSGTAANAGQEHVPLTTPRHTMPMGSGPPRRMSDPNADVTQDPELMLRRQLSRLQRQLAEMQQELANREDELASEVERRVTSLAEHDEVLRENHELREDLADYEDQESRFVGIEQRLTDSLANTEELAHSLERERRARIEREEELSSLAAELVRIRESAIADLANLDERLKGELALQEERSRTAAQETREAQDAMLQRLREASEIELAELRASQERSLQAVRGELEPQAREVQSLNLEREELTARLDAQRREFERNDLEKAEAHALVLRQLKQSHEEEVASKEREASANLALEMDRREEQKRALKDACQALERREASLSQTNDSLRETQKQLLTEVARLKEHVAQVEEERRALTERQTSVIEEREKDAHQLRTLMGDLETRDRDAKRHRIERERFVAFLSEGISLFGVSLPPGGIPEHARASTPPDGDPSPNEGFAQTISAHPSMASGAPQQADGAAAELDTQTAPDGVALASGVRPTLPPAAETTPNVDAAAES
jgi:hypothetical protein